MLSLWIAAAPASADPKPGGYRVEAAGTRTPEEDLPSCKVTEAAVRPRVIQVERDGDGALTAIANVTFKGKLKLPKATSRPENGDGAISALFAFGKTNVTVVLTEEGWVSYSAARWNEDRDMVCWDGWVYAPPNADD